jgi:hypothetical protein
MSNYSVHHTPDQASFDRVNLHLRLNASNKAVAGNGPMFPNGKGCLVHLVVSLFLA